MTEEQISVHKITITGTDTDIFDESDLLDLRHAYFTYWKGHVTQSDQEIAITKANEYKFNDEGSWNYDDYVEVFIDALKELGYIKLDLESEDEFEVY